MSIKNIIAKGIGFTTAGVKWLPTHGFNAGIIIVPDSLSLEYNDVVEKTSWTLTTDRLRYNDIVGRFEWSL